MHTGGMTTGAPTPSHPARPRRSRLRTFLPLGIAAWLVLEIWLLTLVAGAAGGLTVFLMLIAAFVLGAVIIQRAGRRAFHNLATLHLRRGAASTGGNAMMMLGGLLLMLPGMISDVLGLLLLLPPVQKRAGHLAERIIGRRLHMGPFGSLGNAFQQARMHRRDGKVVHGEVIRDDEHATDESPRGPRPPLGH